MLKKYEVFFKGFCFFINIQTLDDNDYEHYSPFRNENSVTWYKDCSEINDNKTVNGLSEIKISGKEV